MNLKLRFALLFTLFVAIILFLSCVTIYFLYAGYREDDYYRRVAKEGTEVHNIFSGINEKDPGVAYRLIKEIHDKALIYEELFILDSAGKVVFRFPDTLQAPILAVPLQKIRAAKEYQYADSNRYEHVALYMSNTNSYVLVSGYDRTGYSKLSKLRLILVFVFLGSLFLSAIISFFFVKEAIKPLKQLGLQMKKTTVQNLTERIEVNETKDEINEIAMNFNAMLERLNLAFDFQKSFVYHASHELRTPLATMLSQTESALSKEMTIPEYQKLLASLKEDQQELIELTNALLLISQYDELGYASDWPRLRIDEIIYETVSHCRRMFPSLVVTVKFNTLPDNDDDFIVRGDEALLKSAFTNLVKNAYMYSIDQKATIILKQVGIIY
jgi:signal transduction histidine kinase